jgi:hypothetical protein
MSDPIPTVDESGQEHPPPVLADSSPPERIGRYRIQKLLGKGGFGIVYLAHDGQLQRLVTIKVPHRHRVSTPEDAEAYLTEARTVACQQRFGMEPKARCGPGHSALIGSRTSVV